MHRVAETHRSYDALQYPALFPRGEDGYNFEFFQTNPTTGASTTKKVSCMAFYAYRIMVRTEQTNHILKCRQLFQQFATTQLHSLQSIDTSSRRVYIFTGYNR